MTSFSRTDSSILGRWWWTLDRWALLVLILLFAVGAILTVAASPGAAARIGLEPFFFVRHQFLNRCLAHLNQALHDKLTRTCSYISSPRQT